MKPEMIGKMVKELRNIEIKSNKDSKIMTVFERVRNSQKHKPQKFKERTSSIISIKERETEDAVLKKYSIKIPMPVLSKNYSDENNTSTHLKK